MKCFFNHACDFSFPVFRDTPAVRNICKVSGITAAVTEERLEAPWKERNLAVQHDTQIHLVYY